MLWNCACACLGFPPWKASKEQENEISAIAATSSGKKPPIVCVCPTESNVRADICKQTQTCLTYFSTWGWKVQDVTSLKRKLQTQCPTAEILVIVVCLYLSYPCSCSLNTQKQEKIMWGSNFECSKVCINGLSIKHLFTHIATHCKPPCRPGCCAARSSAKSDLFLGQSLDLGHWSVCGCQA